MKICSKLLTLISALTIALTTLLMWQTLALQAASGGSPPPTPTIDEIVVSIAVNEHGVPMTDFVSSPPSNTAQNTLIPTILSLPTSLTLTATTPISPASRPKAVQDADLVDNWETNVEDFETDFPRWACQTLRDTSDDGFERYWGKDDTRAVADPVNGAPSQWSAWVAQGGADGVDPASNDYPANMDTWMLCGPFDFSTHAKMSVELDTWLAITDTDDNLFVVASTDGNNFTGVRWNGPWHSDWTRYHLWFNDFAGQNNVWIGIAFHSDADDDRAAGVWIDNVGIWRYTPPVDTCGDLDPGDKGLVVPAYEWSGDKQYPIIRHGDTIAVDKLVAANAAWMRTVFEQHRGVVHVRDYDRMVDTLCQHNISVLGIVNHQTLARQDFNDDGSAVSYRTAFSNTTNFLVRHFTDRITYWEVWNEENLQPSPNSPPYVAPTLYAGLLHETYTAIKNGNTDAQVVFGGLASAWGDSRDYLADVYIALNNDWSAARPFDYFAVHPYFDRVHGLDPVDYMHSEPAYNTIVDKFMETMADYGDTTKSVWITEVGWNSAQGDPNVACLWDIVTTEQEQATYLKSGFDILFNEVKLWNAPAVSAVDKVIWYQYRDTGLAYEEVCGTRRVAGGLQMQQTYAPEATSAEAVPWLYGLHRTDKRTPKPAQCAFAAYPFPCQRLFLPITLRGR